MTKDTCDYNFECYSRCCFENTCSHFFNCYETCKSNGDCKESSCCSEGYCTDSVVCAGNKVISDSCDLDSECLVRHCDPEAHLCALFSTQNMASEMSVLGIIGIVLATLVVVLFLFFCCRALTSSKSSNYFYVSASNHFEGDTATNGGRSGDKGLGKESGRLSNSLIQKKIEDSSEYDLSEEASRMEQRTMLQTQTSRKLLF